MWARQHAVLTPANDHITFALIAQHATQIEGFAELQVLANFAVPNQTVPNSHVAPRLKREIEGHVAEAGGDPPSRVRRAHRPGRVARDAHARGGHDGERGDGAAVARGVAALERHVAHRHSARLQVPARPRATPLTRLACAA
eukprot:3294494-Pleurochrysis_carterae.AAC.5